MDSSNLDNPSPLKTTINGVRKRRLLNSQELNSVDWESTPLPKDSSSPRRPPIFDVTPILSATRVSRRQRGLNIPAPIVTDEEDEVFQALTQELHVPIETPVHTVVEEVVESPQKSPPATRNKKAAKNRVPLRYFPSTSSASSLSSIHAPSKYDDDMPLITREFALEFLERYFKKIQKKVKKLRKLADGKQ